MEKKSQEQWTSDWAHLKSLHDATSATLVSRDKEVEKLKTENAFFRRQNEDMQKANVTQNALLKEVMEDKNVSHQQYITQIQFLKDELVKLGWKE